jgi:hypothetical protein
VLLLPSACILLSNTSFLVRSILRKEIAKFVVKLRRFVCLCTLTSPGITVRAHLVFSAVRESRAGTLLISTVTYNHKRVMVLLFLTYNTLLYSLTPLRNIPGMYSTSGDDNQGKARGAPPESTIISDTSVRPFAPVRFAITLQARCHPRGFEGQESASLCSIAYTQAAE